MGQFSYSGFLLLTVAVCLQVCYVFSTDDALLPAPKDPRPPTVGNDIELPDGLLGPDANFQSMESILGKYYAAFTIIVETGVRQCFHYQAGGSFAVVFEVLKGGDYDVSLVVEDEHGALVQKAGPINHGDVKVEVTPALLHTHYKLCLDNRKASRSDKRVYFEVSLDASSRRKIYQALNRKDFMHPPEELNSQISVERFFSSVENIDAATQDILYQQHRFRSSEGQDRYAMEDNLSRVNLWSAFQLVVMVVVSLVQVFMIRSLFQDPRKGGAIHKMWGTTDKLFSWWFNASSSAGSHGRPKC